MKTPLQSFRSSLNALDLRILKLIEERVLLAASCVRYKKHTGLDVTDNNQEEKVYKRHVNKVSLPEEFVTKILSAIVQEGKNQFQKAAAVKSKQSSSWKTLHQCFDEIPDSWKVRNLNTGEIQSPCDFKATTKDTGPCTLVWGPQTRWAKIIDHNGTILFKALPQM